MAINGIELAVGQKWKTRGGQEVEVIGDDGDWIYPCDLSNGHCVTNQGQVWQYEEDDDDLITLIQDEHGFTPWNGGECPVGIGSVVALKFRDGDVFTLNITEDVDWNHSGMMNDIVAYKVLKQAEETTVKTKTEHTEEPKYTIKEVFDAIIAEASYIASLPSVEQVQKYLAKNNHPDYNLYLQLKAKFE